MSLDGWFTSDQFKGFDFSRDKSGNLIYRVTAGPPEQALLSYDMIRSYSPEGLRRYKRVVLERTYVDTATGDARALEYLASIARSKLGGS